MKNNIFHKVLGLPFSMRQSSLSKNRVPLSESEFIDSIARSGGDREAAAIVYLKLKDWIYHDSFTPYPDDSLGSVFGIAEEELDEDLILDVFRQLDILPPRSQDLAAFGAIDTAISIAQLVAWAR